MDPIQSSIKQVIVKGLSLAHFNTKLHPHVFTTTAKKRIDYQAPSNL